MLFKSTVASLFLVTLIGIPTAFAADAAKPAAKPAAAPANVFMFNRGDSIYNNLLRHKGKRVELILKSGKTLTGKLKEVGTHVIYLEQLQGRDFFDALVQANEIVAVVMRAKSG